MSLEKNFEIEYKRLNKAQKDAVDSIDGPVMVVAGPGTGKTQILALRIGNILKNGSSEADEILCLTFTNSGVKAMKSRLEDYIGQTTNKINISTFHSFALALVEEYHILINFHVIPKLLRDDEAIALVDEILNDYKWEHIRPRTNPVMYFNDLKNLISLLKRERLSHAEFLSSVEDEIESLKNDPSSISSRGETKGQIKKEIEKKIESLSRTLEVVEFYKIYEEKKLELGLMDYDDVLEYAVLLVEEHEDVRSELKEKYQYILVDEHQDSSGVQNSFLKAVWGDVEKPNIFVVGDDRQLIYAFSGAKLSYFEEFSYIFGKAKLITLTENYRSNQNILELSHDLLQSSISKEKLKSNTKGEQPILLNEYNYPRDEILGAGMYIKQKIKEGVPASECALLVSKNYQVREAIDILTNMGLPVSSGKEISFFEVSMTNSLSRILRIVNNPFSEVLLAESLLDHTSGIPTFQAHEFLKNSKLNKLTISELKKSGGQENLFQTENPISKWGNLLENWVNTLSKEKVTYIVSVIGNHIIDNSESHSELLHNVEIVRTFIHLATIFENKNIDANLRDFLDYLDRLKSYGSHVSVATLGKSEGVQVMTLHKSKGLEYKVVWIAHMNEEVFMSEKRNGFTLPEKIKAHINERSVEIAKRELYVAITRAKEFCAISYALENYNGVGMELTEIVSSLPEVHFVKKSASVTEDELLSIGPKVYTNVKIKENEDTKTQIQNFVKENYVESRVSVTLLNNFFECPWKWYFRNFLKLPEVKGVSLALGSAVHSSIEYILNEDKLPNENKVKDKIHEFLIKEGVKDKKELDRLERDAFYSVHNFIANFYPKIEKDYKSERPLQFRDDKFPHLLMYGKIDLTEKNKNDELLVTDFKTGSAKTKSVIEKVDEEGRLSSYMRQLAMYSYLVYGSDKKDVLTSRLLFLESKKDDKNMIYATHIDQEKIDLLLRDIEDYDELLKSGEWVDRPCHFNSYGKVGSECEHCKLAKNIISK